ncbi:MAG: DUF3990 domain-containing protein [Lachnospiraceae bacterium]|nr:DUF3990 domain-containing protein [Lachnospiraceae bacterium]
MMESIDDKSSFVYGDIYFLCEHLWDDWLITGYLGQEIGIKLATPSYEHAAITALRTTDKYNAKNGTNEEPYIVEIDFDCRKANLTMMSYPRHCKEWGNFILNNRLTDKTLKAYNITVHNQDARYDVCWGEIADGNIVNIA